MKDIRNFRLILTVIFFVLIGFTSCENPAGSVDSGASVGAYVGTWYYTDNVSDGRVLQFTYTESAVVIAVSSDVFTTTFDQATVTANGANIDYSGFTTNDCKGYNDQIFNFEVTDVPAGEKLTLTISGGTWDGLSLNFYSSQAQAQANPNDMSQFGGGAETFSLQITGLTGTLGTRAMLYPKEEFEAQLSSQGYGSDLTGFSSGTEFYNFLHKRDGVTDANWDSAADEDSNPVVSGMMDLEFNIYTRSYSNYHEPQTGDYLVIQLDGGAYYYSLLPSGFDTDAADNTTVFADFPEITFGETPPPTPVVIDVATISGVTEPSYGAAPVTAISETAQYTGAVSWSPSDDPFAAGTVYTATITLTEKDGYTLAGVGSNYFTVAGAVTVTHDAGSGVVTAVFPATAIEVVESGFTDAVNVTDRGIIGIGSQSMDMIYANNQASITFPFGPILLGYSEAATLTQEFFISETEVTNALMVEVLQWAYNNGKFSTTMSDHNGLDETTVKHGDQILLYMVISGNKYYSKINYSDGRFSVDPGFENHPAVQFSWYGGIMFCNWLTEMRDGNTENLAYTGIDTTWDHSETIENADNTGYRLPSIEEWEYAARYIGTTAPTQGNLRNETMTPGENGGPEELTEGYYWTPGDYASGATSDFLNDTATRAVGWYSDVVNDPNAELKAVQLKNVNQLGLYDMSGNTREWCFDESRSTKCRTPGGSYYDLVSNMQISRLQTSSLSGGGNVGLRLVRTSY